MYYRVRGAHRLNYASVPFDHYIFMSSRYRRYGVNDTVYKHLNTGEELVKVYVSPKEAYELYKSSNLPHGEADVSPEQRFVCDSFYNVEFPSTISPRIFYLDIETYVTDGNMPSFKNNLADINAVTVYDNYTSKFYSWFLLTRDEANKRSVAQAKVEKEVREYGEVEVYLFDSPKALLVSFIQFVKKNYPDIVTAWNSKFDIPYICRKVVDYIGVDGLRVLSPFDYVSSKVRYALENNQDLDMDNVIPGIDVVDMLTLYKKYTDTEKPSYALKYIAEEELGESKLINGAGDEEYVDPSDLYLSDFTKFCKYNVQDVRLLTMLEDKLKIINLAVTIRNISKVNFQDIFYETRVIDNLLLMEAVRRREESGWNYVLPSKPKHTSKDKYLGAYVKPPLKGLFKWVSDLDFKSLYPSIVKTFLLSTETLVGRVDCYQQLVAYTIAKALNIDSLEYVRDELLPKYLQYDVRLLKDIESKSTVNLKSVEREYIDMEVEYYDLYTDKGFPSKFENLGVLKRWLRDNNFCLLPNGLIVDQSKDDAIIAKVIDDIMQSREKYKKLMLANLERGNESLYNMYNVYQTAVKIINNSVYGATANEGFRLYNLDISEGITTTGQLLIRTCSYLLNKFLNGKTQASQEKDYVITNDTDSIIFTLEGVVDYNPTERDPEVLKKISAVSKECQDYINESIYSVCRDIFYKYRVSRSNNFLTIKNEWLADTGIFVAKKAYAIHIIFSEGVPVDKLKSVGISLRRSSTPKALKPFLENVLLSILKLDGKDRVDSIVVRECERLRNEYQLKDIALPISVNNVDSYVKNLPVHIRGARVWNDYFAKKKTDKIKTGKVKYIYVKKWSDSELNQRKEYVLSVPDGSQYWQLIEGKLDVDYDKMKERLIIKPVESFYNALGWQLPFEVTAKSNGVFNKFMSKSRSSKVKYF
jgi:DNA polymerase elongation subunit (family B)